MRKIGIIPARFGSTRLQGKMLADVCGKPLICRTFNNAKRSCLDEIVVATDDRRIAEVIRETGGKAVMTSPSCPTGTHRVAEAVEILGSRAEIVINIQGDEPCVDPGTIDALVDVLEGGAKMATAVTPLHDEEEALSSSCVKCVFDAQGRALYFSRAAIPHGGGWHRHIGIYGFRREFLATYVRLPVSPLQEQEGLEQLKVLEAGEAIHVCVVAEEGIGVDTPKDLERLCANISSSQEELSPL